MEQVLGSASIRRVGTFGFPAALLVADGETLARLGRDGWLRVFIGRGRRIEITDGSTWRIQGAGVGSQIVPMVTSQRGKLAVGSLLGRRSYGINGRDYAYNLYPTRLGMGRSSWILRQHDTEIAMLWAHSIRADYPVPLAAALLCFTLIKYGVPGEANLSVPQIRW